MGFFALTNAVVVPSDSWWGVSEGIGIGLNEIEYRSDGHIGG
jgi:hypothetical protein